jgi:hypothetical protein
VIGTKWAAKAIPLARAGLAAGSLGILVLAAAAVGDPAAQAMPLRPAGGPAGTPGGLSSVVAVPHSADVWAVGYYGAGVDNNVYYELHLHHGRWQKVKAPDLGGRYGSLTSITVVGGSVWLVGARQQCCGSIQEFPAIWRWTGKKFAPAKLPSLQDGADGVASISGSSASNIWAVGAIWSATGEGLSSTLHWNGKKWSAIPYPLGDGDQTLSAVATTGPDNAWATRGDGSLLHWNGKAWTVAETVTSGTNSAGLFGIAMSSTHLGYAAGEIYNPNTGQFLRPVVLKFNGKKWTAAKLGKGIGSLQPTSVTMSGSQVWVLGDTGHKTEIIHSSGGAFTLQQTLVGRPYTLVAINARTARQAYAVGNYYNPVTLQISTLVDATSNGHSWKLVSSRT